MPVPMKKPIPSIVVNIVEAPKSMSVAPRAIPLRMLVINPPINWPSAPPVFSLPRIAGMAPIRTMKITAMIMKCIIRYIPTPIASFQFLASFRFDKNPPMSQGAMLIKIVNPSSGR